MSSISKHLSAAIVLSLVASAVVAAPPLYRISYLGVLKPGEACTANDINLHGETVGTCGGNKMFIHTAATGMQEIALDVPHDSLSVAAINNAGTVVGSICRSAEPKCEPFIWHALGGVRLLGTLSGLRNTVAHDINDRGEVVGSASPTQYGSPAQPFYWSERNGMVGLNLGSQGSADAWTINNAGQIGGSINTLTRNGMRLSEPVVIDRRRKVTRLGDLPVNPAGQVQALNDAGLAAGGSGNPTHAFIWTAAEGRQDIDGRSGDFSWASDVNNRGEIIGYRSTLSEPGHFYWEADSGMVELRDLIDPADPLKPSLRILTTYRINDHSQVAVRAAISGVDSAVILMPVP